MSTSGLNKLLSEASFIENWSSKDARNWPSLVENPSAEDKLRRAEGKLRKSALLKQPSENLAICILQNIASKTNRAHIKTQCCLWLAARAIFLSANDAG